MSDQTFLTHLRRSFVPPRCAAASVLRLVLMRTLAKDAGPGLVCEKKQKHDPTRQRPRSGPDEGGSNLCFLPRQFLFPSISHA